MLHERFNGQKESINKIKSEKDQKEELTRSLEFKSVKERLFHDLDQKKQLQFLKSLVERGLLGVHTAELIAADEALDTKEIEEIFEKIDTIDAVRNIDRIIPVELRLTKEEYVAALENPADRTNAITKLEQALRFIADTHSPRSSSPTSTVYSFFSILDKNLRIVQENTIDIKRSLEN